MAYNMFLKLDGIKGDCTESKHKDWIVVASFGHKLSQPSSGTGGTRGKLAAGKVEHEDFVVRKRLDSASPVLASRCSSGAAVKDARLELCSAVGDNKIFMSYTFKNCIISQVTAEGVEGSQDPLPHESISIRYAAIEWEYTPLGVDGKESGPKVKTTWDVLANKE